jgi:FixJ family two-component response regulator
LREFAVIAVIDDDVSIRVATDSFLRSRGYTVYAFESAEEFLRSPQLHATACVITDVRMPTMSGIELQTRVRASGRSVPFIFITAFPEKSVRSRAMKSGATCFLAKPFDGPTLLSCVETALRKGPDATSG